MKILAIAAALVLANAPTLALAACSGHEDRSASSCVEGYVWDSATRTCIEQSTS